MGGGGVEGLHQQLQGTPKLLPDRLPVFPIGRSDWRAGGADVDLVSRLLIGCLLIPEELSDRRVPAGPQQLQLLLIHRIAVLLHEALAAVLHLLGEVPHSEGPVGRPGFAEVWGGRMAVVQLVGPPHIAAHRHRALLVQQPQEAQGALDELNAGLVVMEAYGAPGDPFQPVLLLFQFEYMPIKLLLQLLVSVIDAELLQAVALEGLEAIYVQHPDAGAAPPVPLQGPVEELEDPAEEATIEELG